MGMIGKAFGSALGNLINTIAKSSTSNRTAKASPRPMSIPKKAARPRPRMPIGAFARFPASILGQIPMQVGAPMSNAINSLSYDFAFKVGLEFKRRFWEEDDDIYGGITYTDQPIANISYPSQ